MGVEWNNFKSETPVYIINLDKRPERYATALNRVRAAGFTRVERWRGIDASDPIELERAWEAYGYPVMDPADQLFKETYKGKQGCFLSHVNLLRHVIDNKLQRVIVFEDDIAFHPKFESIAPAYYAFTPGDYDLLYMGCQLEVPSDQPIVRLPCYCTHAMVVTLEGAKKLLAILFGMPNGVRTIDCCFLDLQFAMLRGHIPEIFKWYVWNATMYPCEEANMGNREWSQRNSGLVFQDIAFDSDVRPMATL